MYISVYIPAKDACLVQKVGTIEVTLWPCQISFDEYTVVDNHKLDKRFF